MAEWYYRVFGALIWCFDPQYCFDGRATSAGKIGRKKNFFSEFWRSKIRFFWFFLELDHIVWDGQYRLSKDFPGSKESISGQISYLMVFVIVLNPPIKIACSVRFWASFEMALFCSILKIFLRKKNLGFLSKNGGPNFKGLL